MKLAVALHKTLEEIDRLSSPEITKWFAYNQLYGLSPIESWDQVAQLTYYNVMGWADKAPEMNRFNPYCRISKKPIQTEAEQLAILMAAFPKNK